tara:strand:- start:23 stop:187 length:165 start_codon:yes stop_codon:yes gene_type:complete
MRILCDAGFLQVLDDPGFRRVALILPSVLWGRLLLTMKAGAGAEIDSYRRGMSP